MKSYYLQQHGLTWRTRQVEISQSRKDRYCIFLSHEASEIVRCRKQTMVVISRRSEVGELLLSGCKVTVSHLMSTFQTAAVLCGANSQQALYS